MSACSVPREDWDETMDLTVFVESRQTRIPTGFLADSGWSLEDPGVQHLLTKVKETGASLAELCGGKLYRGPATGLNEAFFLDVTTKDALVRSDPGCAEIIKPLIRGRNIDRWKARYDDVYLIFAKRGTDIDKYPSVRDHLSQYRERLEVKPRDWDDSGPKWRGRRPGDYRWCELQDTPGRDFEEALAGPKIVYQEIQYHSWFCYEEDGSFVNNKVFLLPTDNLALLGVLNSPLMWWQLTRVLPHMKDEALSPAGFLMEGIRVTTGSPSESDKIRSIVEELMEDADSLHDWEREAISSAEERFGMPPSDRRLIQWLAVGPDTFVSRVTKAAEAGHPSAKAQEEITAFQQTNRESQIEFLTRQLALEKRLEVLVEDAYGLTPEERELLHATRPIRDPIQVLEAKVRGGTEVPDGPGSG